MKTKLLILNATILLMAAVLSFIGCRKPKAPNDTDTSGVSDNSLAEQSFNDMHQISDEASKGNTTNYKMAEPDGLLTASCATITIVKQADSSGVITVDFGSTSCLCRDGRYRKGKIFISYTTGNHSLGYWDVGSTIDITTMPDNTYFVGPDQNSMNQIIGTRSVTNNGLNAAGHMNWSINVDGRIIKTDGKTIKWTANRTREMLTGLLSMPRVFSISGSASGTSANGTPFNMNITSPLVDGILGTSGMPSSRCHWFTSGTFDFTPGTKPTRHVDFSSPNNGACDDEATVTINSNVYTVHMK
ncbi:MAG: hypothetical protein HY840_00225 [Bacteroidetes bacterium]|nr:hypothetical protein [Bacteroidota bacterium]